MSYTSFAYLLLISCSVLFYYIMPKKCRWFVLLVAGIVFYLFAGPAEWLVMMLSVISSFWGAGRIGWYNEQIQKLKTEESLDKEQKKLKKAQYAKAKKRLLWVGLGIPLLILIVVKYTNFVLGNFQWIIGTYSPISLVVPLGVSFYTFQIISYVMDVYKGKLVPCKQFFKYMLYVSFFPSVVQGPIPRYAQLGEQLYEGHAFRFENIRDGAILILWGFVKKLVLAERLNVFVATIYDSPGQYEGIIFVIATVIFSIQIYADFSGCMDIATGTARLFGIHLQPNFLRPYFSKTLPEFWRRWHATLGSWFRDYVFFPFSISKISLSVNQKARNAFGEGAGRIVAASLPILVVWSLTGIWHGPRWNYVIWGLFHGVLIICSTIFTPKLHKLNERLHINTQHIGFQIFQMLRTFTLCCVGRVFFRAEDIETAFIIIKRTFMSAGLEYVNLQQIFTYGINRKNALIVAVFMAIWFFISLLEEKTDALEWFAKRKLVFRWAFLYLLLFSVLVFGCYGTGYDVSAFIYEQF